MIVKCTPCDLGIFYTEAYTLNDANILLKRIEDRNIATKYKKPIPHQDDFLPHPVSTQPSKSVGQCTKHSCTRPRNKGCTFSMCKSCCLGRLAHEKLCIEHRRRNDGTTRSALRRPHLSASHPVSPLPPPIPPCTPPSPQPVANVSIAPGSSQQIVSPRPSQQPTPTLQQPEIEDRTAAPREENVHRRGGGGRSVNSYSNCTIHIWVAVCSD